MTKRIDDAARRRSEATRPAAQPKTVAPLQQPKKTASAAAAKFKADEFSTGRAKAMRVKALGFGSVPLLPTARPSAPTPTAPASPTDKARADAERFEQTAKTNPQKAAQDLEAALENPDPAYREALLDRADDVVEEIAHSLATAKPEVIAATVTTLGRVSQAAGPEHAQELGEAFAKELEGGLGGFEKFGDVFLPKGPGAAAFLGAMLNTPGMGDFVTGMIEGAKATGNTALLADLGTLVGASAQMATAAFEDAQQKVDQLNAELNALVQGFGPGDEAKLQAAITAFKERHADEYAALDAAGAAMTNVLAVAAPLVESGAELGFDLSVTLSKAFALAPQVLATPAGQAALGRELEAQARGEDAPMLSLLTKLSEGEDGEKLRDQLAPLLSQALGTTIASLKADGRDDEAHALIDSLSDNAALYGVSDPSELGDLQASLHDALDGRPGAIESVEAAMGALSPFLPEGSSAATSLKGLGFVIGVAGLGESFEGFSDAQVHEKVATLASTLGLGVDGASLAIKVFGNPASQASLEKLFGKVSTVTGVIGAVAGVIDFGQTLEDGSIGDVAVSGLNAASGVLLLIPGGQVAGVGLAIASFALDAYLGARRQREAEHASEADAKAFLEAAGLDEEFAEVFSNLDNNKRNIGTFIEEVAAELGLSQDELFERLNESSGRDREKLLEHFAGLSAAAEVLAQFGDAGKLPIFGPPITVEDLEELPDWVDKKALVKAINEQRAQVAEQVAEAIEPLID